MDNYRKLAVDYDALNPKDEIFKQERFFKNLIKNYSIKSCLDCACGTGWHLFMLNKLGVDCSGSDLSQGMLSAARRNLKGRGICLKKEDFRKLSNSWKTKFDMIICMTTSLPHMLTDKDAVAALKSMHAQLKGGGILVIDNGISDSLLDKKPKFIPGRILEDQAFYFFMEYPHPKRVIFNILGIKKTKHSFQHAYESIQYNAMRKSVLEKYFSKTPFKQVHYFGDYDFSKYLIKKSRRLIIIAQK